MSTIFLPTLSHLYFLLASVKSIIELLKLGIVIFWTLFIRFVFVGGETKERVTGVRARFALESACDEFCGSQKVDYAIFLVIHGCADNKNIHDGLLRPNWQKIAWAPQKEGWTLLEGQRLHPKTIPWAVHNSHPLFGSTRRSFSVFSTDSTNCKWDNTLDSVRISLCAFNGYCAWLHLPNDEGSCR